MHNDSDFEEAWERATNPRVSPHVYTIATVYLAFVGFLGVTLNCFVIILFIKLKQVGVYAARAAARTIEFF